MCIQGTPTAIHDLSPNKGIRAWRTWNIHKGTGGIEIRPTFKIETALRTTWERKLAKANGKPTGRTDSDIGIHANTLRHLNDVGKLVGQVCLFGKVVEYQRRSRRTGYLAQYAEIIGFSISRSRCDAATVHALAAKYDVKVLA